MEPPIKRRLVQFFLDTDDARLVGRLAEARGITPDSLLREYVESGVQPHRNQGREGGVEMRSVTLQITAKTFNDFMDFFAGDNAEHWARGSMVSAITGLGNDWRRAMDSVKAEQELINKSTKGDITCQQ